MIQPGDFYEDDEPIEDVAQAFESGEHFATNPVTAHGWCCQHVAVTSSANLRRPKSNCGCEMTPTGTR